MALVPFYLKLIKQHRIKTTIFFNEEKKYLKKNTSYVLCLEKEREKIKTRARFTFITETKNNQIEISLYLLVGRKTQKENI